MTTTLLSKDGCYPDVEELDGVGYVAWRKGDPRVPGEVAVATLINGIVGEFLHVAVPSGPAFPRLGAYQGVLYLVLQEGPQYVLYGAANRWVLGPALYGPPAIGSGWVAWQDAGTGTRRAKRLDSDRIIDLPGVRPTGLSRIVLSSLNTTSSGTGSTELGGLTISTLPIPVFVDDDRYAVLGMTNAAWSADGLVVGEHPVSGARAQLMAEQAYLLTGTEAKEPRVCHLGAGVYLAAAWGADGVQAVTFDLDTIPPPPVISRLPDINRPFWSGCFFAHSARPGYRSGGAPGNCEVIVEPGLQAQVPAGQAVIIEPALVDEYRASWDRVVALYVAVEGDSLTLRQRVADAKAGMRTRGLPQRPVLSYSGTTTITDSFADWIGIQAYYDGPTWDLDLTLDRWVASAQGKPAMLIAQAYDRGLPQTWTPDELLLLQPAYARALAKYPTLKGVLWFAYGRPGGIYWNPQIYDVQAAIVSLSRGVPALETIATPPPPKPPEVTPVSQPYPSEPTWWLTTFKDAVKAVYDEAGKELDENYPVWFCRASYDIAKGMTKEDALAKHIKELRAAHGLNP